MKFSINAIPFFLFCAYSVVMLVFLQAFEMQHIPEALASGLIMVTIVVFVFVKGTQ